MLRQKDKKLHILAGLALSILAGLSFCPHRPPPGRPFDWEAVAWNNTIA
jgi:hypothetical protein